MPLLNFLSRLFSNDEEIDTPIYKQEKTFEERKRETDSVFEAYPDRVPVVLERHRRGGMNMPILEKRKYLVPKSLKTSQLIYIIRRKLCLEPSLSLFFFTTDAKIIPFQQDIGSLYEEKQDEDGYLYILYAPSEVFG